MSNIPSMNPSIQITPRFARRARGRQDPSTGPLRIQSQVLPAATATPYSNRILRAGVAPATPAIHPDLASQTLVDNITHNDSLGDPDMQSDHEQESIISDPVNAQRTMESPPLEELRAATNMSSVRASLGLDEAAFHRAEVLSAAVRMDPWMATSMMYVAVNHRIEQLTTTVQNLRLGAATPLTQPMVGHRAPNFLFQGEVRLFIRARLRGALIIPDLHWYGRTRNIANRAAIIHTPVAIVKGIIDQMDLEWKMSFLPPGYNAHDPEAIRSLHSFLRELLKYEKSALAKAVMTGGRPGRRSIDQPIPRLDDIIVNVLRSFSPQHELMARSDVVASITHSMRIRICYIRLHMYIQRALDRTITLVPSPWDIIDRHLEVMRRQSRDYKFAYGRLLLEIDEEVFNGINTAADVALIALELPTEQDVRDLLARRAAVPAIIEVEERQAQGEIF
ncbi:hypothetical protein PSTT_08939 [Puccinia striiformis]|uniref:Uncharacterized protein n=1 Tax=Puccinia striiformis TaxID=27350 RepID=A0A2S4VAG2_9BASI|nr:hypothetical protein PSTT_08939 [Puccinia striiformis]